MRVQRMALNAGPFGDHAEGRKRRPDAAVQIDGRFDDASPRLRLLLSAPLEGVGSAHFRCTRACIHIDRLAYFRYTQLYSEISADVHRLPAGRATEKIMETRISEIADGIYRFSTFVPDIAPPAGFTFNQFLVLGDEPLMFHTGLRKMFPLNRDAASRIIPLERLRWIAFGRFEADECGAMNEWLAVAPQA